jgi:hypothetical protein
MTTSVPSDLNHGEPQPDEPLPTRRSLEGLGDGSSVIVQQNVRGIRRHVPQDILRGQLLDQPLDLQGRQSGGNGVLGLGRGSDDAVGESAQDPLGDETLSGRRDDLVHQVGRLGLFQSEFSRGRKSVPEDGQLVELLLSLVRKSLGPVDLHDVSDPSGNMRTSHGSSPDDDKMYGS